MKTPLAWRNVLHTRTRSLSALAGISFATVLIFMQLGFYAASETSATLVYDTLDFDLIVVSPGYTFVARAGNFPRHRLEQAKAVAGVESATPVWVGLGNWRNPETRLRWGTILVGVDPALPPFRDPSLNAKLGLLTQVDTALFDSLANPTHGPVAPGARSEVRDRRLTIVGDYRAGTGFVAGAGAIVSDRTMRRLRPSARVDRPSLGLINLAPGISAEAVIAELNAILAPDARVYSRSVFYRSEQSFWLNTKPIGIMFTSGLLIAVVVGSVILYQVLSSEVQNRIRDFATLKALGYHDRYIYGVILKQAAIFALLGFLPALVFTTGIYHVVRVGARLPVEMELGRVILVAGLTAVMCVCATALAVRKLRTADPADLF